MVEKCKIRGQIFNTYLFFGVILLVTEGIFHPINLPLGLKSLAVSLFFNLHNETMKPFVFTALKVAEVTSKRVAFKSLAMVLSSVISFF